MKGSKSELNLMKVMLKRLNITGSTLRIRNDNFKGRILSELKKFVFPLLIKREIKCYIDSSFDLKNASDAHKRLDEGKHIGKIVLKT